MSNILKGLKKVDGKKTGIFAAGVLFGTAGIKVLSSKDAKKIYTHTTAAALRMKETVMDTVWQFAQISARFSVRAAVLKLKFGCSLPSAFAFA